MQNGIWAEPYAGATIQASSPAGAVALAKRWAQTVDGWDDAWLQVFVDGKSVANLAPGQF